MAKQQQIAPTPKEIQRVSPQLPDFLRDRQVKGVDALKEFVIVPRLKVIQKSASAQYAAAGGTGDVVLSPTMTVISRIGRGPTGQPEPKGPPVYFTPIFFYVDWATWNPMGFNGPPVVYRTVDPKDPIVAKSRDKDLRKEVIVDDKGKPVMLNGQPAMMRHVEHLNWIIVLHDHEVQDPFVLTFSRGEHFTGRKFAGQVRMRHASPFHMVFEGRATFRAPKPGTVNDWYGFEPGGVPDGRSPWVASAEQAAAFERLHDEFAQLHSSQGLRADLSDADDLQQGGADDGFVEQGPRDM